MLLSFDIEISNIFKLGENEDIEKYAPLFISVAATSIQNGEEYIWYSEGANGRPETSMNQQRANQLLEYLANMQRNGYMVCAWNGLSFDLRWIGYQAKNIQLAAQIALKSYDPMFQFFNQRGFPVALAKVAKGMGISQEKLLDGADAPIQWNAGNYKLVMDYCLGDCQITNQVISSIQKNKEVRWVTAKGHISSEPMSRLKTVEEVIKDPEPDQSWMDTPIPKLKFYQWVQEATGIKT